MTCARCGAPLAPSDRFCPHCGTPRPNLDPRFAALAQQAAALRQHHATGQINDADYQAALRKLMTQDEAGVWWTIGADLHQWYRYDGRQWMQAEPPTDRSAPAPFVAQPGVAMPSPAQSTSVQAAGRSTAKTAVVVAAAILVVCCLCTLVVAGRLKSMADSLAITKLWRWGHQVTDATITIPTLPPLPTVIAALPTIPAIATVGAPAVATVVAGLPTLPVTLPTLPITLPGLPQRTPTPTPARALVFAEDFDKPMREWEAYVLDMDDPAAAKAWIGDGELHIQIQKPITYTWVNTPAGAQSDFTFEITARQLGNVPGFYGLYVYQRGGSSRYLFLVAPDGRYTVQEGLPKAIGGWASSAAIATGQATNDLRIISGQGRTSLIVNGQELRMVNDSSLTTAFVALVAGTFEQSGFHAAFDGIRVASAKP